MTKKEMLQQKIEANKAESKALKARERALTKQENSVSKKEEALDKILQEYKSGTGALMADNLMLQARALERLSDEIETAKAGDLIKIYGTLHDKAESFAKSIGLTKEQNQNKNTVNFYVGDLQGNTDDAIRLLEKVAGRMKRENIQQEAGVIDADVEMEVIDVPGEKNNVYQEDTGE